jgi:hypothetical protein
VQGKSLGPLVVRESPSPAEEPSTCRGESGSADSGGVKIPARGSFLGPLMDHLEAGLPPAAARGNRRACKALQGPAQSPLLGMS